MLGTWLRLLCQSYFSVIAEDRLFFQIAAGLIPVLLFGSAVTALRAEWVLARIRYGKTAIVLLVAVFVMAALAAEFVAIDLSLSSSPIRTWKLLLVIQVLAASASILGLSVVLPWFEETGLTRRLYPVVLVFAVLAGTGAVFLTRSALNAESAQALVKSECRHQALIALLREISALHQEEQNLIIEIGRRHVERRNNLRDRRISPSERNARADLIEYEIESLNSERKTIGVHAGVLGDRFAQIEREGRPVPGC